jgi:hypothetical protein
MSTEKRKFMLLGKLAMLPIQRRQYDLPLWRRASVIKPREISAFLVE